ncbi:hypothetical protein GIB67_023191 [Kingdonia uniflora]|uniref:BED-type domain-containing protein n=1 Tax=Kingdonia uniflora TaxID=39325 RepID=A0A7J7MCA3_9MAGN|nr:hypothetical protein GIB67_023191 [Kingdonia uniflora]
MAQVGSLYTCRAGYMKCYRANTKKNNGRYFYRCPQFKNQCKSFIYEDVLVGGLGAGDLGQGGEQVGEYKQVEIMRPRIRDNYLTYAFIGCKLMDPIVELDNDNDINIDFDGDDMEMEGIDGPLSDTEDESVSTLARKPSNHKRKLTSHVWVFFEIFVGKDKKERAKCKKCGVIYLSSSAHGTGNLSRHLKTCKKTTTRDLRQMFLSQSESSMSLRAIKFDPVIFREMLNLAIIKYQLPFKFVEYEGIRDAFNYAVFINRDLKLVFRNTSRADAIKIYEKEKRRVMRDSKVNDVVESAIEELAEELSLLDVGQNVHGVAVASDNVESSKSASDDGNGLSGSGTCVRDE